MDKWSDGASGRVEDQWDRTGMHRRRAHVDSVLRARLPAGKFLAIRNSLVQSIDMASPNMEVMEMAIFPTSLCENISPRETSGRIGDMIVKETGILDSNGPERGISHVRPMNGGMEHHGIGNFHNCANAALCYTIVVVSTNPSKADDLLKVREMLGKILGSEGTTIVSQERLGNNSMVTV